MTDSILKLFSSDWWELYLTITSLDFLFCLCLIWRYNRLHKNWIFYAYNALCLNNGRTPFHVKNNIRNSSYCLILVKKKETNAIAKVYKCKIYNSYWFNGGGRGGSRISQIGRQPKKGEANLLFGGIFFKTAWKWRKWGHRKWKISDHKD